MPHKMCLVICKLAFKVFIFFWWLIWYFSQRKAVLEWVSVSMTTDLRVRMPWLTARLLLRMLIFSLHASQGSSVSVPQQCSSSVPVSCFPQHRLETKSLCFLQSVLLLSLQMATWIYSQWLKTASLFFYLQLALLYSVHVEGSTYF